MEKEIPDLTKHFCDLKYRSSTQDSFGNSVLSQKAIGICAIYKAWIGSPLTAVVSLVNISPEEALRRVLFIFECGHIGISNPVFLRSCPENPRPGVIENLTVENSWFTRGSMLEYDTVTPTEFCRNEIFSFLRKLKEEEPNGAVVIQQKIDANVSWVTHYKKTTAGFGHNGVTAGIGRTLSFSRGKYLPIFHCFPQYDSVKTEVEFVSDGRRQYVVQLRASTRDAAGTASLLPGCNFGFSKFLFSKRVNEFHVAVVSSLEDLSMEGELKKRAEAGKDILILHYGGNPLSHWRGQALLNEWSYAAVDGIETITHILDNSLYFTEVARGSVKFTEEPTESFDGSEYETSKSDFSDSFWKGIDVGFYINITEENRPRIDLNSIWGLWRFFMEFLNENTMSEDIAFLSGVFASQTARIAYAICAGEARHAYDYIGDIVDAGAVFGDTLSGWLSRGKGSNNRDAIYRDSLSAAVDDMSSQLKSFWILKTLFQEPLWKSGYGGEQWANICEAAMRLLISIKHHNMDGCLRNTNTLLNIAHNSGWAFNKVCCRELFANGFDESEFFGRTLFYALRLLDGTVPLSEKRISTGAISMSLSRAELKRFRSIAEDEHGRCYKCKNYEFACCCDTCKKCGEIEDECTCNKCHECGCHLEDCECERCEECGELLSDCECEVCCGKCNNLIGNCTCSKYCSECGDPIEDCSCNQKEEDEEEDGEEEVENKVIVKDKEVKVPDGFWDKEVVNG